MICRKHDRAAPLGTGSYKVGGNYAASLLSLKEAHDAGFSTSLYLDAREKNISTKQVLPISLALKAIHMLPPIQNQYCPQLPI
jgi:branched-chain amino acid aminotransferase